MDRSEKERITKETDKNSDNEQKETAVNEDLNSEVVEQNQENEMDEKEDSAEQSGRKKKQKTDKKEQNDIRKEITKVINSGSFILGKKVKTFEKEFAHFLGIKFCIGVASGNDALKLALLAVNIKTGDKILIPANSYPTFFLWPKQGLYLNQWMLI